MKQSLGLDLICVKKILKHIHTIGEAYTTFNIHGVGDLSGNHLCQLAITQAITNIYELRQRMTSESIGKMPMFSRLKLGLKAARNIASHDYDSLDFNIIYRITNQLKHPNVTLELEAVINDIQQHGTSD